MYFLLLFFIVTPAREINGENIIQMKIVDEVSNYGWNAVSGPDSSRTRLKSKVTAMDFRGPQHLKTLVGKCYVHLQEDYKYEFCPFQNVTQHERSMRWNPYSGILGVWRDWDIANNTFVSMNFKNGDSCGDDSRSVKVDLICGLTSNITSVEEPRQCCYKLTFTTPLVCHDDSMLVYPTMNSSLQVRWDKISQDLHNKYITPKGYERLRNKLLIDAGLTFADQDLEEHTFQPQSFQSLETCNVEYAKLYQSVAKLQTQVTNKPRK